jgi:hypothetical protein
MQKQLMTRAALLELVLVLQYVLQGFCKYWYWYGSTYCRDFANTGTDTELLLQNFATTGTGTALLS